MTDPYEVLNIPSTATDDEVKKAYRELARKYQVQLPIIEQVNEVLFAGKSADQAVKELMLRDKKLEVSDLPWR